MTESVQPDSVANLASSVQEGVEAALSTPIPETAKEKLAFLEAHLRTTLAQHESRQASQPVSADFDPNDVTSLILAAKVIAKSLIDAPQARASRFEDLAISKCGWSVVAGCGLITAGVAFGGGLGGMIGFGAATYHMANSCGEGDEFLE